MRAVGNSTGRAIGIGLTPSLMRLVGVDLLVAAAEAGGSELRLVEALSIALTNAVERREIDLAFAYEAEEQPGLVREPVLLGELLFVAAPGGPQGPISFTEAVAHELCFTGDHGIVALVRRTAASLSLTPHIVSNIQSVSAIHDRIAEGDASLLSYGTAAEGVQRGIFSVRRIERPALTRTLYLLRRADSDPALNDRRLAGRWPDWCRAYCAFPPPMRRCLIRATPRDNRAARVFLWPTARHKPKHIASGDKRRWTCPDRISNLPSTAPLDGSAAPGRGGGPAAQLE